MIPATIITDDRAFRLDFDATDFFRFASEQDIVSLHQNEWSGEGMDKIGDFFRVTSLKDVYDYLDNHEKKGTNEAVGFEVSLVSFQAIAWLNRIRPEVLEAIQEAENTHVGRLGR